MLKPAALLLLAAATLCPAQQPTAPRHFRLTFVVTDSQTHQPPQSFNLDIPAAPGKEGAASLNTAAGLTGQEEGSVHHSLECTAVHPSPTGLSAQVSLSIETILPPMPGVNEAIHRKFTFNKQIDVPLNKPSRITDETHLVPLGNATASAIQPITITVTATEI